MVQQDRSRKPFFVLGVYASSVHARWFGPDGRTLISAMAVASEPDIFWRGENAEHVVARIHVPPGAGKLVAAGEALNGPSGQALDKHFLAPLHVPREKAWLCDLLPESRMNSSQAAALEREYRPRMQDWGLPEYSFPPVPRELASPRRREEIAEEIVTARSEVLVTLGDKPLRWFAMHFGAKPALSEYGDSSDSYGRRHKMTIAGHRVELLPLVHPRQAGRLGSHSPKWASLHENWSSTIA